MKARYYGGVVGRFISPDPMWVDTKTGENFNRYWYANNNPYKFTDPDGRLADTILDIGFVAYSTYALITEPSWTNAAALGADVVGAVVPFATGLGAGVRAANAGADIAHGVDGPIGDSLGKAIKHGPSPKINEGQQGKHQVGHNNFQTGRSELKAEPSELGRHAGTGQQVGRIEVGLPGSKERVDFGQSIGTSVDQAGNASDTTVGIIHYGKNGIHIVPARPKP